MIDRVPNAVTGKEDGDLDARQYLTGRILVAVDSLDTTIDSSRSLTDTLISNFE